LLAQKDVLIFIHILALTVALGGSVFQVFILPLIAREKSNQKNKIQIIARSISLFSPISFGMLSIVVFTGILLLFSLTKDISNISSSFYLNVFSVKIVLVTAIFSIAAFQTFNLRFKIVFMDINKINEENPPKQFRFMRTCSIINIILTTIVVLLGITMSNLK
tara:strand:- start:282 stop:770 length:489 start_codon:yes stop_codon:yes gene_type:complete